MVWFLSNYFIKKRIIWEKYLFVSKVLLLLYNFMVKKLWLFCVLVIFSCEKVNRGIIIEGVYSFNLC